MRMSRKIKVLTLGDHPLSPSGVGTQTKYVCEALLKTEKFSILSLGGAIKHHDYTPVKVEEFGEDWRVIPVDGYGSPDMIRSVIRNEKPDIVWIMTDPRFWGWLWQMENEIRPLCPIVYYHVWDNYPYPMYNKKFYESNDHIVSISKLTDDIVRKVAPKVACTYLPHAVDNTLFRPATAEEKIKLKEENFHERDRDKFVVFWNNRNARRKQSGTLVWWWKEWLDERDLHDKAMLVMHTAPKDQHGQDLAHIADHLGLTEGQIVFSTSKVPKNVMPFYYMMADATINISDAEGFGLSTLESLSCGVPIIATVTGGLQEQIMTPDDTFGFPIFPTSKSIIGSQDVPYIYEDRVSKSHVLSALSNMYDLGPEGRRELGAKGRQHVVENYNFEKFNTQWVDLMLKVYEEEGSWETRKNANRIIFKEVA
jgi:glycosyltransferase involved in cell wall biosynthesis